MSDELKTYAIIDAAAEPTCFEMFQQLDPERSCLYEPPLEPDVAELAPYLVLVNDDVENWLQQSSSPWGIYLTSYVPLVLLRQHLRQSLQVFVPGDPQPQLFRFYDPRIIWLYLDAITDEEIYHFLGPVVSITTPSPDTREDDYQEQRKPFREHHYPVNRQGPLPLTQATYQAIVDGCIQQLEVAVAEKLESVIAAKQTELNDSEQPAVHTLRLNEIVESHDVHERPDPSEITEFSKSLVSKLSALGITQKRLLVGIAELCATFQVYHWQQMPDDWIERLSDDNHRAVFNAQMLMIDHLGYVPA